MDSISLASILVLILFMGLLLMMILATLFVGVVIATYLHATGIGWWAVVLITSLLILSTLTYLTR